MATVRTPRPRPYDWNVTMRLRWQLAYYRAIKLLSDAMVDNDAKAIKLIKFLEGPR